MPLNPSNPSLDIDFLIPIILDAGDDSNLETDFESPFIQEAFRNLVITNLSQGKLTTEQGAALLTSVIPSGDGDDVVLEGDWETDFERIIALNNILPSYFFNKGIESSKSICKIEASGVDYRGLSGEWGGTGFLIAPDILLTNHHVLNSKSVASRATLIFDYERISEDALKKPSYFRLDPDSLFITSPATEYDFTMVRVKNTPGDQFGFIPLNRNPLSSIKGLFANVVHHPSGDYKSISIQDNQVVFANELILHYLTDTESGSSGAPIFNNNWELLGLHHASKKKPQEDTNTKPQYVNEGIKLSAIAAHLEEIINKDRSNSMAAEALRLFNGTDPLFGFFGSLGREPNADENSLERLVDSYSGNDKDIDIGFWNIEWFNNRYEQKLAQVAEVIYTMKLDIWGLSEVSPDSTKRLIEYLKTTYALDYDCAFSEPGASSGKQSTTVIWNKKTVKGSRQDWPASVSNWFKLDSREFSDDILEAVHGKIFDRYPGLFHFEKVNKPGSNAAPFDFYVVPLHLKAMTEGSLRRDMASKILAAAIHNLIEKEGFDKEWILGGDYNATLASNDFNALSTKGFTSISAEDAQQGSFSYLKKPYQTLIDLIFLSPNMAKMVDSDDFYVVANDRHMPNYVEKISDHRPVLMRLSLKEEETNPDNSDDTTPTEDGDNTNVPGIDAKLKEILDSLNAMKRISEPIPANLQDTLQNILRILEEIKNKLA